MLKANVFLCKKKGQHEVGRRSLEGEVLVGNGSEQADI